MKIIKILNQESDAPKIQILLIGAISGFANGFLLVIINWAGELILNNRVEIQSFVLLFLQFVSIFLLFIYTSRYAFYQASQMAEEVLLKVRLRIINKIRQSELQFIEKTEYATLYTPLTQGSNLLSEVAIEIVRAGESLIVLIFSGFYLTWLSPISFLITLSFIGVAIMMYLHHEHFISEGLDRAFEKETQLFGLLSHILKGFKELKINRQKNDDVFTDVEQLAKQNKTLKVDSMMKLATEMMYNQIVLYLLLAILIFIIPLFSSSHNEVIFKVITTILFIIGAAESLMMALPEITRANVVVEKIYQLEAQLDQMNASQSHLISKTPIDTFQKIRLANTTFRYTDSSDNALFSVGPLDMTLNRGEMLFIVGGNGSGKSTLLKLLTGLYYPATGFISVDDDKIDQTHYHNYRELFSIIFTDFHLFDKLYGLHQIDEQLLKSLLHSMQLDQKTQYADGQFTNLELSTGQKKRLAFITAILENKPIYVFDELAADQDPAFRQYFYEVVLQELKQQGKTIIAVTHDDKYFHVADRVLKMEYGQFVNFKEGK
jgi:putative pyoverdin transport system ATP-binding/permease protein